MKRKPKTITGLASVKRKQKTCQWVEGFKSDSVSGWHSCTTKAMFEVQYKGVTVAHVCLNHSLRAVLRGWQIR